MAAWCPHYQKDVLLSTASLMQCPLDSPTVLGHARAEDIRTIVPSITLYWSEKAPGAIGEGWRRLLLLLSAWPAACSAAPTNSERVLRDGAFLICWVMRIMNNSGSLQNFRSYVRIFLALNFLSSKSGPDFVSSSKRCWCLLPGCASRDTVKKQVWGISG